MILEVRPKPLRAFDQVPAMAETLERRVRFLLTLDVPQDGHLLILGDDDFNRLGFSGELVT